MAEHDEHDGDRLNHLLDAHSVGWCLVGLSATAVLVAIANELFNRYWLGTYEPLFEDLIFVVPFLAVPAVAILALARRRHWLYLLSACSGDLLVFLVVLLLLASNPIPGGDPPIFHGPRDSDWSLLYSLPPVWGTHTEFVPLNQFTADALNRIQPAKEIRSISYVPGDIPSTGPGVVSVNPIDRSTWGAASFSIQHGQCYLVVYREIQQTGEFSGNRYWILDDTWTKLPAGSPCVGTAAN